ncbi:MAG: shikimate dehydrogenase, partial [Opitutaceae bacterium]
MSYVDPVHTLADLESWPQSGTWLAVLGHPIKHSISPAMHNAALAMLAGKDARFSEWRYVRFDVPPEQLPLALDKLREQRFLGVNLTVPHKVIAFAHISQIDEAAQPVGAINTLHSIADGWKGYNTDGYGLAAGLREEMGIDLADADVIIVGAGGAARGAGVECLQQGVRSLWIANRTSAKTDILLAALTPLSKRHAALRGFAPAHPPADLPSGAVVINATSAGLKSEDPAPIDLTRLPSPRAVFDMIYNP